MTDKSKQTEKRSKIWSVLCSKMCLFLCSISSLTERSENPYDFTCLYFMLCHVIIYFHIIKIINIQPIKTTFGRNYMKFNAEKFRILLKFSIY